MKVWLDHPVCASNPSHLPLEWPAMTLLCCIAVAFVPGELAVSGPLTPILTQSDARFLEEMAGAVVEASRVRPGESVSGFGPNITGGTVVRPGGRNCYPAFWIRDYAMSLESGMVAIEEQRHMLLLTASHQQDTEWELPSGSVVTPGSIPDHISFGGKPIFYPGTLDDYEGQGGPKWGHLPSLDDAFYFIHMAAVYVRATGDASILDTEVGGKTLIRRLEEAYAMPPSHSDTGLVYADEDNRGVTFGFVDSVTHTGDLLFCSVLKYRAARELAELFRGLGETEEVGAYGAEADRLREAIGATFPLPSRFLRASTGTSAQPDVWGTAFAVYVDALTRDIADGACRALAQALREETIAWRGNIRHVPTDADYSAESAWEKALTAKNTYQNGAYWNTPTGWVCYAVARVDRLLAADLARAYIEELREGDFRRGPEFGSPWECMHPAGAHRQNPVYMTSVTCPLGVFLRMATETR